MTRLGNGRTRTMCALLTLAVMPAAGGAQQEPPAPPPATAQSGPAPEIPAESFAALPFFEGPDLSPDGTRVAVRIAVKGNQHLAIIPLADTSKAAMIGAGKIDLNSWQWVNDGWLIIRVGTTQTVEGDDFYVSRADSVSADGKKIIPLKAETMGQNAANVLWAAIDGSPHALIAMQRSIYMDRDFWPEVRDFDVSTGRSRSVVSGSDGVMRWYTDGTGLVRYGIGYSDATRSYRALYRDKAGVSFRTIERARGAGNSLDNVPSLFLPEAGKAIAVHDNEDGFSSVFPLDLTTMTRGAATFSVPGFDIDGVVTDDARTTMLGVRYTDTFARTKWFDSAFAAIQADLDKAVAPRRARIVTWNRDRSVLVIHVSTASSPGVYYVYRTAEGTMHMLARVNAALANTRLSPVRTITYKARDGLEIPAVLTLPAGRPPTNLPLILMPHGGPAARDDESWDWQAQFLANRGYAVLQPNYRGSTGYGTKFTERGRANGASPCRTT